MHEKRFLFLGIVLTSLLLFRFLVYNLQQPAYRDGDNLSFETRIYSQIKQNDRFQTFTVKPPDGKKIYIVSDNSRHYFCVDKIKVIGRLQNKALNSSKAFLAMFMPKIESNYDEISTLLAITLTVRQRFIDFFEVSRRISVVRTPNGNYHREKESPTAKILNRNLINSCKMRRLAVGNNIVLLFNW